MGLSGWEQGLNDIPPWNMKYQRELHYSMSTYIYPYKEAILRYIRRNNRDNGLLGASKCKL